MHTGELNRVLSRDTSSFQQDGLKTLILSLFEKLLQYSQTSPYLQRKSKPFEVILHSKIQQNIRHKE